MSGTTARAARCCAMGALVLLLGARELACGASIVAVRVWPADDYTRVTIESDARAVGASTSWPSNPPRLVIDIDGLELSPALRELVGKVRADDPFIAGVRVGQNQPRVVRLVIDLKQADRAAAVHAGAGGGLPAPPGVRPLPDAGRATRCWR